MNALDILSAAKRYSMFAQGGKVLVAVSGGPDSVAMLHALHEWSEEIGIKLHIAHLNHGIRGEESNSDEEFVRQLADSLAIPITVERVSVPQIRNRMRAGEEEAARIARHAFFQETAAKLGCNKIAVGHTADDRAETILLNIIRGTGIEGLAAMRPVTGNIVRPLIDSWRSEIEEYLTQHNLEYRVDTTNLDTTYARNRVRHRLIPLLKRDFNPQVKSAIVRLARIAESQQELIERTADQARLAAEYRSCFDAQILTELPDAILAQIVRTEIEKSKGDLSDVTFEQIERVVEALRSGSDFSIALPTGALYAEKHGSDFRIGPAHVRQTTKTFELILAVPGRTQVRQIGLAIDAEIVDKTRVAPARLNVAFFDTAKIKGSLRVRNARPGDRIRPFGMRGTKKLQDLFVDKKVPLSERTRAAVVVDDEKVLWVVGVAASEDAKVTSKTTNVVRLAAVSH
ncbi:MAG: tRNA lysidine(34) synthetase TilS [Armatimonadetes bacterium]|nr:tRNA lysidine(34) synthetase TilS [Armatimonadota bacterium]